MTVFTWLLWPICFDRTMTFPTDTNRSQAKETFRQCWWRRRWRDSWCQSIAVDWSKAEEKFAADSACLKWKKRWKTLRLWHSRPVSKLATSRLSTRLSVCELPICPSVGLTLCLSAHLPICPPSVCLHPRTSIPPLLPPLFPHMSLCLSVCWSSVSRKHVVAPFSPRFHKTVQKTCLVSHQRLRCWWFKVDRWWDQTANLIAQLYEQ